MPTQNAWGLTYRPAHRKLVALAPERAEQFWKRHAKGFPKDEAERLIEEYTVVRKRNHSASGKN